MWYYSLIWWSWNHTISNDFFLNQKIPEFHVWGKYISAFISALCKYDLRFGFTGSHIFERRISKPINIIYDKTILPSMAITCSLRSVPWEKTLSLINWSLEFGVTMNGWLLLLQIVYKGEKDHPAELLKSQHLWDSAETKFRSERKDVKKWDFSVIETTNKDHCDFWHYKRSII